MFSYTSGSFFISKQYVTSLISFLHILLYVLAVVGSVFEVSAEALEFHFQAVNLQTAKMLAQFGNFSLDL